MSVVRLEITVPDEGAAYGLANKLTERYVTPGLAAPTLTGVTAANVEVLTDADALRERTILAAARYFLPEGGQR